MDRDELRAWISRHSPVDAREAEHLGRMVTLLESEAPFARDSFDPGHFTASAFVRSPDLESVLLIHHRKLGIWVQPGGHIDAEDTSARAAAVREIREETGLGSLLPDDRSGPIFDVDVHRIPARKSEPAHEHFDLRFSLIAADLTISPSIEVQAARWVRIRDVETITRDESVLRAVRKLDSWR